jgi:hypothetical protein
MGENGVRKMYHGAAVRAIRVTTGLSALVLLPFVDARRPSSLHRNTGAAAAGLYGSRGGNGVVGITTMRAR